MPESRVLVVGDANVDLVLRGDIVPRFGQAEQLLDDARLVLGSSAGIAACGLAALGVETHLAAVVGDDEFGRFTRDALGRAGVGTTALSMVTGTPTGISVILSGADDRAILTLPGTVPLLTAGQVAAAVERLKPTHVHFASYFLLPELAQGLPELLADLRSGGITTSLDTNWDPSGRWSGLAALLPAVDILFPNLEELRAIASRLGWDGAHDEGAARAIAARGPRVVVKAGAAGGWSLGPDGERNSAPGLALEVVDTTGAGDSFDAGYLAALSQHITPERLRLRWAAVAGSLSTRGVGGTAAQGTLSELMERLPE
ncbi:MAG TPA: carbohydrate kinase family protein [Terrimesophilobacter sp.]|jgi:Sugar kinases, ribokinase family|uniref:carbohydrate kinase family protein n=1 Tax=Terrimesophilobacter sp. TaxID=2906435 RepID=UPI002F9292A1